jgi:hypothetical protein
MRFKLKFSPNIYFDKLILLKRVQGKEKAAQHPRITHPLPSIISMTEYFQMKTHSLTAN